MRTRDAAATAIIAANAFNTAFTTAEIHHHHEGGVEALATPLASPPFPPLWEDDDDEEVVFDRGKFSLFVADEISLCVADATALAPPPPECTVISRKSHYNV